MAIQDVLRNEQWQAAYGLMRSFVRNTLPSIEPVLIDRAQSLVQQGINLEPFSARSSALAVSSVDEPILNQFKVSKVGAQVKILHSHEPEDYIVANQAYFVSQFDSHLIVDFTPGALALDQGTSLDQWLHDFPGLFIDRVLVGDTREIKAKLMIGYPDKPQPFHDFLFLHLPSPTKISCLLLALL